MDTEIFRDLLDRHSGFPVTGDAHDIVTKLGGVRLRHNAILPGQPSQASQIRCHLSLQQSLDREDGWWEVSSRIWEQSVQYATERGVGDKLRRVVASTDAEVWGTLAQTTDDSQLVGWVSNLDEFRITSEPHLISYGRELLKLSARGQGVFALYGGFFSVLLGRVGLTGASHGIGYGEHRDWVELPSSGAPPARYYVPKLHRYIGVDIAVAIWRQFPELISCDCEDCDGQSPASLDYHALMRHSVRCRSREIGEWLNKSSESAVADLHDDYLKFRYALGSLDAPPSIVRRAEDIHLHLEMWGRVIQALA